MVLSSWPTKEPSQWDYKLFYGCFPFSSSTIKSSAYNFGSEIMTSSSGDSPSESSLAVPCYLRARVLYLVVPLSCCSTIPRAWSLPTWPPPLWGPTQEEGKCPMAPWEVYISHFYSYPIGQNLVTWPHLTAKILGNVVFILTNRMPS